MLTNIANIFSENKIQSIQLFSPVSSIFVAFGVNYYVITFEATLFSFCLQDFVF